MYCDITYTVPYTNHDFSSHNFILCIMWSSEHLWMHYMKGYEDKNTWSDYCRPISFIDLVKSVYHPLIHAVGGQHTILLAPCASHLEICPGLHQIRCTRISISVMKCPLALLANFNITCVSEYRQFMSQSVPQMLLFK